MLIALASGKGAPGTTTTALALAKAWPRPVVLVEMDPRSGSIAWGYGRGRDTAGRGLLSLQLAARRAPIPEVLWSQVIEIGDQTWWLPGLEEPHQVGSIDWAVVARGLHNLPAGVDVIADCGAVPALSSPRDVWASAQLVVLIVGSSLPSTRTATAAANILRSDLTTGGLGTDRLVSVCVGPGRPYPVGEVAAVMDGLAPMIGSMPWDPRAAEVWSQGVPGGRRFERSAFTSDASKLAVKLGAAALQHQLNDSGPAANAVPAWAGRDSGPVMRPRPMPQMPSPSLPRAPQVPHQVVNGWSPL